MWCAHTGNVRLMRSGVRTRKKLRVRASREVVLCKVLPVEASYPPVIERETLEGDSCEMIRFVHSPFNKHNERFASVSSPASTKFSPDFPFSSCVHSLSSPDTLLSHSNQFEDHGMHTYRCTKIHMHASTILDTVCV